ncbi:Poly A polymerase, head domain [Penicillium roqueforti FM164]|uniref:Poly A polymerase, head domain n=1 Tax=Penicillium roqueforti (strain FM164) TaxID=1365484 RepID=W6Q5H6_PENRF|nr:Poly A polymerase, head domain [Penicillium roqueforti FM164]
MQLHSFVCVFKASGISSVKAPFARTLARRAGQIRPFQQHLPLRTYSASVPRRISMRNPESDPDFSERVSKRRRISSPTREGSYATMSSAMPTIELTPLESTLRTLLLDVAQYITEQKIANGGSTAKDHSETVLRFTGGWVRDKLLGVESHDIDVGISNMTGYQFGMALKDYLDVPENLEIYKKGLPNGEMHDAIVSLHKIEANPEKSKHLETVTTKIFGLDIDLVNLRKETYTDDSRNPQMEFGTAVEDALRRDATINALFYNLNESRLEDLTERGLNDMKKKIIRCPMEPYQTFKDDPLRVLRLIRFASRLGYQIEPETEAAMQIEDIREALKLKISKERVGTELEKMLRGPDPRGALQFIDRLHLFTTIFANHQDEVKADTSTWPFAYNTLARLLHPEVGDSDELQAVTKRIREILFRDKTTIYYAWMIATFAPWTSIPGRTGKGSKPLPPRAVEVGRDGLRSDNKTLNALRAAALHYKETIATKTALLTDKMSGTPAEIRQCIGLQIRSWNKDWKLCILLAILQENMALRDFAEVAREYDQFLAYIVENDLEGVCDLKPIVNGDEIMKSLGSKKGPWMSKAVSMALEWQLLHPDIIDKETVLEEIAGRRAEFE